MIVMKYQQNEDNNKKICDVFVLKLKTNLPKKNLKL